METAPLPTPDRLAEPDSDTAHAPVADLVGVKASAETVMPAIETDGKGMESAHVEPLNEMVGGEVESELSERLRPPRVNDAAEIEPEPVATPVVFE
jgi:hypothetical protein